MTYRIGTVWALLPVSLFLSACGGIVCGNAHDYQGSVSRGPLKAPPGITVPAPDSAYTIPGAATATGPQSLPCMIQPPELIPATSTAKKPEAAPAPVSVAHPAANAPASATGPKPAVAAPPPME